MAHNRQVASNGRDAGTLALAPGLLLFAPLALLGNFVGSALRYPEIGSAILFPPYAALTAALVASPRRHWPWYILVGAAAHFLAHWPQWVLTWVFFADVANVARAITAAVLLRHLFRGAPRLDSMEALARFALSAVVVAPAVGATLGAANVVAHDGSRSYLEPWTAWFMSNALTGLTMLPAFVLLAANGAWRRDQRWSAERIAEGTALGATLALSCAAIVFARSGWYAVLALYAPLPALIWTALRFHAIEVSLALTVVTFAAILGADRSGPFVGTTTDESILMLQLFVVLTSIPILCMVAVTSTRRSVIALHRALLASARDSVAVLDARGTVVAVNDAWNRGAQSPDVAPHHRVAVGSDYLAACRGAADRGDSTAGRALDGVASVLGHTLGRFEMEYEDERAEHRRYAFSVDALAHRHGGAIVRRADVTARHRAQLELEEQRRQLSHLARVSSLGQLSGALAHELNQPLASIGSNAEAARHLIKRQPADLREIDVILGDIVSENQRAAEVIRRLRALLRRGETRLQPLDPAELIDEVLELAHAELITRRVIASKVMAPNLPPIHGDRVQLQQVLLNLILNACEAMRSTPVARRRLSLRVTAAGAHHVQISVRDGGVGIPETLIDRLFEPFATSKPEGLGLGLSISRTIVAAHGGRLWAENNDDGGATLHCLLGCTPTQGLAGSAPVLDAAARVASVPAPR